MFLELPLDAVTPSPLNPRRRGSNDVGALCASIADKGVIQPIVVRPFGDGYQIVAGERRYHACRMARDSALLPEDFKIPATVRECSDHEAVILAALENFGREDLDPMDEAELFRWVRPHIEKRDGETTEAAIGRIFHISERTVFRRLALLSVPAAAQPLIAARGSLNLGAAAQMAREAKGAPPPFKPPSKPTDAVVAAFKAGFRDHAKRCVAPRDQGLSMPSDEEILILLRRA